MKKFILSLGVCSICIWLQSITYEYNQKNLLSEVDYGNGYVISYTYDSNGNLTSQIITQPNVTPLAPTQFSITRNGDMKTLSWEPVTSNINGTPVIVPLYVIEASSEPTTGFTLIGTTSQTQFTDTNISLQKRFYRIIAVIGTTRENNTTNALSDQVRSESDSKR